MIYNLDYIDEDINEYSDKIKKTSSKYLRSKITNIITETIIHEIRWKTTKKSYFSKEVLIDYKPPRYGDKCSHRCVDIVQYIPPRRVLSDKDIENGKFICYEIKSCKYDVYSGNGLGFYGDENWLVTTVSTYNQIKSDILDGTFETFLRKYHPNSEARYGIKVIVPRHTNCNNIQNEFNKPTQLEYGKWKTHIVIPCPTGVRTKTTMELLFGILRSKECFEDMFYDSYKEG